MPTRRVATQHDPRWVASVFVDVVLHPPEGESTILHVCRELDRRVPIHTAPNQHHQRKNANADTDTNQPRTCDRVEHNTKDGRDEHINRRYLGETRHGEPVRNDRCDESRSCKSAANIAIHAENILAVAALPASTVDEHDHRATLAGGPPVRVNVGGNIQIKFTLGIAR